MGWYEEFKKTIGAAAGQLTNSDQVTPNSKPESRAIHFTNKFQQIAKHRGLSEQDARDVYFHGEVISRNMMVRKYQGYELGIWFFNDHVTGQAIITSIWKRGRR